MKFNRIIGVTNKLIADIEKIFYWTNIVVQSIFFGYYGYSIYSNIHNLAFLIIYSLLLIFSTMGFVYYLRNYQNKDKANFKAIRKTFRISRYAINGSMLVLNMIEIIRYGGSQLTYTLIAFSTTSLFIQIIVEFVRNFSDSYIDLFRIAIEKDTAFLRSMPDIKDFKGNLLGLVDAPLGALAKKGENKKRELSENEKLVESLANKEKEKGTNKKKIKRQENVKKQGNKIKEHLNIIKNKIFRKKEKNVKPPVEVPKKNAIPISIEPENKKIKAKK